jgi:plastocyanin
MKPGIPEILINPGETFSYEFTDEGSFDYFCIPHCDLGMEGNITVEE